MATKTRSTRGAKSKPSGSRKSAPAKRKATAKPAAPAKRETPVRPAAQAKRTTPRKSAAAPAISVNALKKTIAYYYLLAYCPPEQVGEFAEATAPLRKSLADSAAMSEKAYFNVVLPEVCRRIVSYHEATREPGKEWVEKLAISAAEADKNVKNVTLFQEEMSRVARLPGRALPENRLHRKKGCQYCRLPCAYGYFTLISEPAFRGLQQMLDAEMQKPADERSPLRPVWGFTVSHLAKVMQAGQGVIRREHLGNLAYCLLMLSMAKSRLAVPEAQLQAFQAGNQALIQSG
jgi:hypothetical protein